MSVTTKLTTEFYHPFDPVRLEPGQRDLIEQLCQLNQSDPVEIRGFTNFCIACHLGFRNLTYAGHVAADEDAFIWVSNEHARKFSRALNFSMNRLCFQFTTFEGPGFFLMAAELAEHITIEHFVAAHKSGDPASVLEGKGLAELITKARCQTVSWWSSGFEDGAVDVFVNELERLENRSLKQAELCDLQWPEPQDRLVHVGLENLLERNR